MNSQNDNGAPRHGDRPATARALKAPSMGAARAALVLTTALAWGIAVPSVVALRHAAGGRMAGEPISQQVLDDLAGGGKSRSQ